VGSITSSLPAPRVAASENQGLVPSAEHAAGLRAAGNGRQVAQLFSVDHLDRACCSIGDEDAATLEGHIAVIEVPRRLRWQGNVLAQS
jgi:hypothetical protein